MYSEARIPSGYYWQGSSESKGIPGNDNNYAYTYDAQNNYDGTYMWRLHIQSTYWGTTLDYFYDVTGYSQGDNTAATENTYVGGYNSTCNHVQENDQSGLQYAPNIGTPGTPPAFFSWNGGTPWQNPPYSASEVSATEYYGSGG